MANLFETWGILGRRWILGGRVRGTSRTGRGGRAHQERREGEEGDSWTFRLSGTGGGGSRRNGEAREAKMVDIPQ